MMNKISTEFTTIYWFSDSSTKVVFEPGTTDPPIDLITACMVFAFDSDKKHLVLAKPERGWGLPGGHCEADETPEQCAEREFYEETNITIKNLKIIGCRKAERIIDSDLNSDYPDIGYLAFYIAQIDEVHDFEQNFETSDRAIVAIDDIGSFIEPENIAFYEILDYAKTCL